MESIVVGDSLVVTVDKRHGGVPAMEFLRGTLRLPDGLLAAKLRQGEIVVGRQPVRAADLLAAGQRIRLLGGVDEAPDELGSTGLLQPLEILYEDAHALIVNKPHGVLVYPGTSADNDTMAHRVAAHYAAVGLQRRVRHVHRLDRDTTGALLYANHAYSAKSLDAMLVHHEIHRVYAAVLRGKPAAQEGMVEAAIGRDRHVAGKYRVSVTGKPAVTRYRVVASKTWNGQPYSLVLCKLWTGRTHQIRVHMAHLGTPIAGDPLYATGHAGSERGLFAGMYGLHALTLSFHHPYSDQIVRAVAPTPTRLHAALERLGLAQDWRKLMIAADTFETME